MNNKITNFVMEVNADLDYTILDQVHNGFTEAIKLREFFVFDDDNDSTEFFRQLSLARTLKHISLVKEIIEPMLDEEVDKFFSEKVKNMREKFTDAKLKYHKTDSYRYNVSASGKYNEDIMEQFLEQVAKDFRYIFEGFIIDVEY
jgi:hypothetical protein